MFVVIHAVSSRMSLCPVLVSHIRRASYAASEVQKSGLCATFFHVLTPVLPFFPNGRKTDQIGQLVCTPVTFCGPTTFGDQIRTIVAHPAT